MREKELRFAWLQALRGVAALAVVIAHSRLQLQSTSHWAFVERWLKPGVAGVDLFFVVSGFIMIYTLRNDGGGAESARVFALKRFTRVWPAYVVVTLLTFILELVKGQPADWLRLVKSVAFIPADYSGLYSNQTAWQGWTLNYEMYFYAVLFGALFFTTARRLVLAVWFGVTLLLLPLLAHAPSLTSPFMPFAEKKYPFDYLDVVTNPIIWDFVGGALAGTIYLTPFRLHSRVAAMLAIVAGTAGALFCTFSPAYNHGPFGWGWGYTLLIACFAIADKEIKLHIPHPLILLGDMSYTLYLVHLLIIGGVPVVFRAFGLEAPLHTVTYLVFAVVLSIALASVSYKFLERTLSSFAMRALERRS